MPDEPEALGLLALMLHAEARRGARRSAAGDYVPLAEQDPALWDAELIAEAEALLLAASRMGKPDRYQLEAAVQSAHAIRRATGRPDWAAIRMLYDALAEITGSPVVAINRAIAIAETDGPAAGLAALSVVESDARLAQYQPYWAARAALLAAAGDIAAADAAYEQAIGLEADPAVRRFLQQRRRGDAAEIDAQRVDVPSLRGRRGSGAAEQACPMSPPRHPTLLTIPGPARLTGARARNDERLRQPRRLSGVAGQFEDVHPGVGAVDDVDVAAVVGLGVVGLDRSLAAVLAVDLDAALVGRLGDRGNVVGDLLGLHKDCARRWRGRRR